MAEGRGGKEVERKTTINDEINKRINKVFSGEGMGDGWSKGVGGSRRRTGIQVGALRILAFLALEDWILVLHWEEVRIFRIGWIRCFAVLSGEVGGRRKRTTFWKEFWGKGRRKDWERVEMPQG